MKLRDSETERQRDSVTERLAQVERLSPTPLLKDSLSFRIDEQVLDPQALRSQHLCQVEQLEQNDATLVRLGLSCLGVDVTESTAIAGAGAYK